MSVYYRHDWDDLILVSKNRRYMEEGFKFALRVTFDVRAPHLPAFDISDLVYIGEM